VFYAKTSNVDGPYVFWFAVSLVFYLRLLQTLALRNFVLFAITATLAVCTKDQAYALYALMPLPVLIALWNQGEAPVGRRWRNLFDWRIAAAVGAALVTFAVGNNLVLNPRGFVTHFNFVTAQYYEPSFEAGIAGRAALSGFVARQIAESLSWPSTIAAVWGLVVALRDPALRFAGWTLVPVVSYWLVFLNVIRYSFDRFLLPVCVVAAIFAGFAFARFLATGQWWRRATAAGALSFTVLYALPVDMMMVSDARYTAERWVNSRKSPGDRIGMLGFKYMPLLPRGSYQVLVTLSELRWFKPTYVMVNADYTRRRPVTTTERAALAALDAGELGYRRLFSERSSVPWDWMPGMHPSLLGDRTGPSFSNLEHINPRMEIFVRDEN
jgi:hypothetical protein